MAIVNFLEYTSELTGEEIVTCQIIVDRLRQNVGKKNRRTNKFISGVLKLEYGLNVSSARMRKIINHIRVKGLIQNLIADSGGYYVSNDPDEINKYIFSLRQRGRAILHVAAVMEDYANQQHLKIA